MYANTGAAGDLTLWAQTHRKRGIETATRIKINFYAEFGQKPLDELSPLQIEKRRSARLIAGKKSSTVNQDIAALKGALSKATEWGILIALSHKNQMSTLPKRLTQKICFSVYNYSQTTAISG